MSETTEGTENDELMIRGLIINDNLSLYKDAILGYIGGYVVHKILKHLSCAVCADALICENDVNRYYFFLTHLKDNGGLDLPVWRCTQSCQDVRISF